MPIDTVSLSIKALWIKFMKVIFWLISLLIATAMMPAAANSISVKVIDLQGNPVEGAVLENMQPVILSSAPTELAVIDQIDKSFVPEMIVIRQGQRVDFPNSDNIRHHVYSFSAAKTFELKLYADRPEKPITFDKHGVVVLGCNIHDGMVGYIYVAADEAVTRTDSNGQATLELSEGAETFSLWHPYHREGPEYREQHRIKTLEMDTSKAFFTLTLAIEAPAPRDTFEDTFDAFIHE